jgi:peptide/nickel transport system substrate-binding protein
VTETIGSGPFVFARAEWVQGSKVVYRRNAAYVPRAETPSNMAGGKRVKVDRVDWIIMPDEQTAVSALLAGEVDVVNVPPPDLVPTLKRNADVVVEPLAPDYIALMRPNHLHPPFNNVKARQALALLVDQRDYLAAAFGGLGKPCFAYFTCTGEAPVTAGSEPFQRPDPAKARQLLAEAGYKGEKIVQIGVSDIFFHNAIAQVTIEKLRSIGVAVDPQLASAGVMQARRAKKDPPEAGGYNLFQTSLDTITLSSPLTNIAAGTGCDGRNWPGWPCDEEASRLQAQYINATDEAEQRRLLEALNRRLWEVIPYVILAQFERPSAWRKNIVGLLRANFPVAWNVEKR